MANGGWRPGSGRPKAQHTIQAEAAKASLIQAYLKEKEAIHKALIDEAKKGNVQAIRELFERVHGAVPRVLSGDPDNPLIVSVNEIIIKHGDSSQANSK